MEVYVLGVICLMLNCVLFFALFRLLITELTKNITKPLYACLIFWLALVTMPLVLFFAFLILGNFIYTNYATLRVASWDVALTFVLPFYLCVTYVVGLVFAVFSTKKFLTFIK
jgi:uncharacterized RDD family membrane protein YckC